MKFGEDDSDISKNDGRVVHPIHANTHKLHSINSDPINLKAEKVSAYLGLEASLRVATDVINYYSGESTLLKDYKNRRHDPYLVGDQQDDNNEKLRVSMDKEIKIQEGVAKVLGEESLRGILTFHFKNPDHYAGTYILSVAKELKGRHESGLV